MAVGIQECAPRFTSAEISKSLDFLIGLGLADDDDRVREQMVAAGVAVVDSYGASCAPTMLPLFEGYLAQIKMSSEEESTFDLVREGVVVFLGTLARHLPAEDPKRRLVMDKLLQVRMV